MKTGTELVGMDELISTLNMMSAELQKNVLTPSCRIAAKPLLEAAQSNLSADRNGARLIGAMKIKAKRKSSRYPGVFVGYYPKVSSAKRSKAAWEAMGGWWLEFGTMEFMEIPRSRRTRPLATAQRRVGAPPSMRGRIRPIAFMRRAWDSKKDEITKEFNKSLWKGINSYLKRKARKLKWSATV